MKLNKKRVISVAAIIIVGLTVFLTAYHYKGVKSQESALASSSDTLLDSAVDTAKAVEKSGDVKIDFNALKEQNQDIYAWIVIPGTIADYPVVQKMDAEDLYDDYYLNHTIDFVEGYPGAIYSQAVNSVDFTDSVTVLYGHNMKDGSMFGCLHEFENRDFFDENHMVIIYTQDYTFTYEIFAEVSFSDALITYEYDFSNLEEVRRYLDDVRKCDGYFNDNVEVTENDNILTLSTCFDNQDSKRFLVVAVLTEKRNS